jgi:CDP-4-dehydro-6-deoxyglucose reductase, E3
MARAGRIPGRHVNSMHIVRLRPSGREIHVLEGETVLHAALRQNINLPYGCKNGICGLCKAYLSAGVVNASARLSAADSGISKAVLLCCARPETDLLIAEAVERPLPARLQCRVISMDRVCPDVMVLELQLQLDTLLSFIPGQYIDFILDDGTRRSFSIANSPRHTNRIQIHVRKVEGGKFTSHIFEATKRGDCFQAEGPRGAFCLKPDSNKPITFLASGTGFAPIKSIMESMIEMKLERPATLYWGARKPIGLYMHGLARYWARHLQHFKYVPVVSERAPGTGWRGRVGPLHRAVAQDLPNLSGHEVYACGTPAMVAAARMTFASQCQLPPGEFHADPFTTRHEMTSLPI